MTQDINKLINSAVEYYNKGNIPQAEIYCRYILEKFGNHPDTLVLLGIICIKIKSYDFAINYLQQALEIDSKNQTAETYLNQAIKLEKDKSISSSSNAYDGPGNDRENHKRKLFIVIKAWGYGFWSDIDHVLGQLLLAEITGRIPIIEWGDNSLFLAENNAEAFTQFFEPVSDHRAIDLIGKNYSYYPPKWSDANLFENEISKWMGNYSRLAGIYMVNRDEDVLVSDFHTTIKELHPWIRKGHHLYGLEVEKLYQHLIKKYLKLKPSIEIKINDFWLKNIKGRNICAIHVRGTDKEVEVHDLDKMDSTYHEKIHLYLEQHTDTSLLLLTDSSKVLEHYILRYGKRIIFTNCTRTDSSTGLHHQKLPNPDALAIEVIIDAYLATRCDSFIGNGYSNVSLMILHMKEWPSDTAFLCGRNMLLEPNFYLHEW